MRVEMQVTLSYPFRSTTTTVKLLSLRVLHMSQLQNSIEPNIDNTLKITSKFYSFRILLIIWNLSYSRLELQNNKAWITYFSRPKSHHIESLSMKMQGFTNEEVFVLFSLLK